MYYRTKLHAIWKYLIYLRYPLLLTASHSLILFNPCVKVKSCTCQYFSLSHKILSISSPSLATTCSINWTCKYSVLQMADIQTFKRWLATARLIVPILILESFLKTSSRTNILFAAAFTGYQINYVFEVQVKVTLLFHLRLVAWQVNSVETTIKFFTNITFSATLFIWNATFFYWFRKQRWRYEFLYVFVSFICYIYTIFWKNL